MLELTEESKFIDMTISYDQAFKRRNASKIARLLRAAFLLPINAANIAGVEGSDPQLSASIGAERIGAGRMGMSALVMHPNLVDEEVEHEASEWMQAMATSFGYPQPNASKVFRSSTVFARYDRSRGVELETDPLISCGLTTTGGVYSPEDPVFELTMSNLYSHEQQIICLAGCIAIAKAGQLDLNG